MKRANGMWLQQLKVSTTTFFFVGLRIAFGSYVAIFLTTDEIIHKEAFECVFVAN